METSNMYHGIFWSTPDATLLPFSAFPFLELLPEIRNNIYHLAMMSDHDLEQLSNGKDIISPTDLHANLK